MAPRIKTSVLRSQLSKAGYLTGTALAGLGLSFGRNKPVSEAATPDEDLITSSIEEKLQRGCNTVARPKTASVCARS
jgi:hypothetical protein